MEKSPQKTIVKKCSLQSNASKIGLECSAFTLTYKTSETHFTQYINIYNYRKLPKISQNCYHCRNKNSTADNLISIALRNYTMTCSVHSYGIVRVKFNGGWGAAQIFVSLLLLKYCARLKIVSVLYGKSIQSLVS